MRTPEIIMKLEQAFGIGANDLQACSYAGISKTTYYRWREEDEELRDSLDDAKERQVLKALNTITNDLRNPQTAKWLLEKKHPDFKPRQVIETPNDEFESEYMKALNESLKRRAIQEGDSNDAPESD